jgi:predicted deacylase
MTHRVDSIQLPHSTLGTHRRVLAHHFGQSGARPKAYFQASLHADEWPGMLVAEHLIRRLRTVDQQGAILGEVVVVPVANPIGLSQHVSGRFLGRYDLLDGRNFNRGFPDLAAAAHAQVADKLDDDPASNVGRVRQALQNAVQDLPIERERDAMVAALLRLSIDSDYVLDMHCDDEALLHIYAAQHDRDTAVELGSELGADVVLLEQEAGGAPFDECNAGVWWRIRDRLGGSHPLPLSCFATTVEFRGRADISDALAQQDSDNLMRFLQRRGVVGGTARALPETRHNGSPLDGVDIVRAPGAGLVAYQKALGSRVRSGESIGDLIDPMAEDPAAARIPLISRADGILFARLASKMVRPGQSLAKIAGSVPLPHRKQGNLLES